MIGFCLFLPSKQTPSKNKIIILLLSDDPVVFNNKIINKIRRPDLWIKNLYKFKLHTVLKPTTALLIYKESDRGNAISNESVKKVDTVIFWSFSIIFTINICSSKNR